MSSQIFIWLTSSIKNDAAILFDDLSEELGIGVKQIDADEYVLHNGETEDVKMENICILISHSKVSCYAYFLLWSGLIDPSEEFEVSLPADIIGRLTLINHAVSRIINIFKPTCFRLAIAEECEYISSKTINPKLFLSELIKDTKDGVGPYYIYNFDLKPM
jgi:hypothetical protein